MSDNTCQICGGCVFRDLGLKEYRQIKEADFKRTLELIKNVSPVFDEPIFIEDGMRRRADMAFQYKNKELKLGFKEAQTHNIVDIKKCPMILGELNELLEKLRRFLEELCQISVTERNRKKIIEKSIKNGSVQILKADNGIDIVLNTKEEPDLKHRLLIAEFMNANTTICRFSWCSDKSNAETIVEKISPQLYIADCIIDIPQGVFLQASKNAETAMIKKVLEYMGTTRGKIADLFCGLGTFTYPLAKILGNEIISVDSFEPSLQGLRKALNKNQLHNVTVMNKNLFKEPMAKNDWKNIKAAVIDPPRAGAHEQIREILNLDEKLKPEKIVFVSCNPKTFVYDAELLINAGYNFERVTLIDQFVYAKHEELVALFTFNPKPDKGE